MSSRNGALCMVSNGRRLTIDFGLLSHIAPESSLGGLVVPTVATTGGDDCPPVTSLRRLVVPGVIAGRRSVGGSATVGLVAVATISRGDVCRRPVGLGHGRLGVSLQLLHAELVLGHSRTHEFFYDVRPVVPPCFFQGGQGFDTIHAIQGSFRRTDENY